MDNETYEGQEIAAEELGFVGEQSEDVGGLETYQEEHGEEMHEEDVVYGQGDSEDIEQEQIQDEDGSSHVEEVQEYPEEQQLIPEEQYQHEVVNDEVVDDAFNADDIQGSEEIAEYEEEAGENIVSGDDIAPVEYVAGQSVVEDQQEEIVADHDISIGQEFQESESLEPDTDNHQGAIGTNEILSNENAVVGSSVQEEQDTGTKGDTDDEEDFDNVVEVEQKLESDIEGENVAQHVSDSENEGEEKREEIKLGNVSEDDLRGASSGSEHEASDVEDTNVSPVKKRPAVLSSDDEGGDTDKVKEQDPAVKMFDSDSEDEEKEGVGELIADIFGESDDEGEEFTGFGAEEVKKKLSKAKAAISDDSEDDSPLAEAQDSDDEEINDTKVSKKSKSVEPEDSDSDEGVTGGSSFQGMSDFDIMLAKKKEENRRYRRRKDNSTFISDSDDIINAMLTKMKEAAESDRDANQNRKPALAKMKMLPSVVRHLKKQNLKESFVDNGVIAAIADWLSLLPDRSLPHITIRTELLKVLHDLPPVGPETLKHSGIGKAVMIIFKHPKEARSNRDSAGRLINKWSRPIFGLNENFKSMSREEREQRDLEQMPQAKRRKLTTGSQEGQVEDGRADAELGQLRPGEAGFIMRARVPMPSTKDYVVRPKWNIDAEDKDDDDGEDQPARIIKRRRSAGAPRSSKKDERLDKHIRNFAERKKSTKLQRAVKISIEGNKMSIV